MYILAAFGGGDNNAFSIIKKVQELLLEIYTIFLFIKKLKLAIKPVIIFYINPGGGFICVMG